MAQGNTKAGNWDDFGTGSVTAERAYTGLGQERARRDHAPAVYAPVDYSFPANSPGRTIITVENGHVSLKVELPRPCAYVPPR